MLDLIGAAALATLALLEQEYIANAATRGQELREGLLRLQTRHPIAGDVRGLGLMQALDLVRPGSPPSPDPARRDDVVQASFRRGLLLLGCGESALRFCPPLCITSAQVQAALTILDEVLSVEFAARAQNASYTA